MTKQKRLFYYLFVFTTGTAVMMLEFAASRIMAPWFGSSIFVWGNIIGVILIALSLGYYMGGRIADKNPQQSGLMKITLTAGLFTSLIPIISTVLMSQTNLLTAVNSFSLILSIVGSFMVVLLVFATPICLLGMVSPYVIRLATSSVSEAGKVAGTLYAVSTIGSIVGTFASAFVLVPFLGSRETVLLSATALILVSVIGYGNKIWLYGLLLVPLGVYMVFGGTALRANAEMITETETLYQYVRVQDDGERLALLFNEGLGTQSYFMKSGVLTGAYYDYLSLIPYLQPLPDNAELLVLGMAGGTITRQYDKYFPDIDITGVELDPEVVEIAKEYFALDEQDINIKIGDARNYVRSSEEKYDIIIIDAYTNEYYIPWHMTTLEFFGELKNVLVDGGVVGFNVGSFSAESALLQSMIATLYEQFNYVVIVQIPDTFNYVVMASDHQFSTTRLQDIKDERRSVANVIYQDINLVTAQDSAMILTDNRAPIEFFTESMIVDYIKQVF
ncbi:MAG: fused MFS/spermidine synthase [bacterium]|nr:fused MFS/spermidine synthase [bacterium]